MENLNILKAHPEADAEAVTHVFQLCEDAIREMRDFAEAIGCTSTAKSLDNGLSKLDSYTQYWLNEAFKYDPTVHDITNTIIKGCFDNTIQMLDDAEAHTGCELLFTSYEDREKSKLCFVVHKDLAPSYANHLADYKGYGDAKAALDEILITWLCEAVYNDVAKREGFDGNLDKSALRSIVAEDLKNGRYSKNEIAEGKWGLVTGELQALADSLALERTKERFELSKAAFDVIHGLRSMRHLRLDGYLDDVVLNITKDPDYECVDEVRVEFEHNGEGIAYTFNIRIDNLEVVLNDIRDGNAEYLCDKPKTLGELIKEHTQKQTAKNKDDIGRD